MTTMSVEPPNSLKVKQTPTLTNGGRPQEDLLRAGLINEACKLRIKGFSFNDIARILSISQGTAFNYVHKELDRLQEERKKIGLGGLVEIDSQRLEGLVTAFLEKAFSGDESASKTVMQALAQRAKLLGLNAPERKEITATLSLEALVMDAVTVTPAQVIDTTATPIETPSTDAQ